MHHVFLAQMMMAYLMFLLSDEEMMTGCVSDVNAALVAAGGDV